MKVLFVNLVTAVCGERAKSTLIFLLVSKDHRTHRHMHATKGSRRHLQSSQLDKSGTMAEKSFENWNRDRHAEIFLVLSQLHHQAGQGSGYPVPFAYSWFLFIFIRVDTTPPGSRRARDWLDSKSEEWMGGWLRTCICIYMQPNQRSLFSWEFDSEYFKANKQGSQISASASYCSQS